MIVIYRVEHPGRDRTSPYGNDDLAELLGLCAGAPDVERPGPTRDPLIARHWPDRPRYTGYKFGFATHKSYRSWFNTEAARAWLSDRGYVLAEYLVPFDDVVFGMRQVLFDLRRARHLRNHDCRFEYPQTVDSHSVS